MIKCCNNCERRSATCHATCPDYAREKEAHESEREAIRKNRDEFILVGRYKADAKRKTILKKQRSKRR